VYGIYPHSDLAGLLPRAADVRFRPWGKLETIVFAARLSPARHRWLDRADSRVTALCNAFASRLEPFDRRRRLNSLWYLTRRALVRRLPRGDGPLDAFVLECYSFESERIRIVLEYFRNDKPVMRHAFDIEPGHNYHTLPAGAFQLTAGEEQGRLLVYPENDAAVRLAFTWLDFVGYAKPRPERASSAEKVKCVAWDLDNTLWNGILLEDGAEVCTLKPGILDTMRALDARGILQTIVSKNDHDLAIKRIALLGVEDLFLYPAVNWGSKSENLRQIAEKLNIDLNTFAFVDDSPFERAEVARALPMVRVYTDAQANSLLQRAEFDVPVTELSRVRRQSYLENMKREHAREHFPGDYFEFLRSCRLSIRLFSPRGEKQIGRCLELIQRSNQLNLSTRRYSAEELELLLKNPNVFCVALECSDRFGNYGLVGFAAVEQRGASARVRDFVLSCRVAQKRVEHSFFRWLGQRQSQAGVTLIQAEFRRTARNQALGRIFDELPFRRVSDDGEATLLQVPAADIADVPEVNELVDEL